MKRRGFMGLMAAAVGMLAMRRPDRSRVYSVRRGDRGSVLLDGKHISHARSCKTGANGWVSHWELDDQGCTTGLAPVKSRGRVVFIPEVNT